MRRTLPVVRWRRAESKCVAANQSLLTHSCEIAGGIMRKSSTAAAQFAMSCIALLSLGSAIAADPPKTLPLASAIEIAQTAIAACKANGYNVTVMVMDQDFSPRLVMRSDAAAARTTEIARRKAYTVVKMGMTSGEFGKQVAASSPPSAQPAQPRPPGSMPPGVNGDENLITFAGGKPIKVGGELLGAMAVSGAPGGDKDEACVDAGLAKLK